MRKKLIFLTILTLCNFKKIFTSTSGGHSFVLSWDILDFSTENERLETKKLMISLRQVDSGTLEAVKSILPNVLRKSGVPEIPKISNCLFSKGFCSNLVQYTFLTIEIDITLISGVSAHFREHIRISAFSALALDQGKLGPTLSSYFAFKGQPMVQVTSKTSWGLYKVHFGSYMRSLGGLVVK